MIKLLTSNIFIMLMSISLYNDGLRLTGYIVIFLLMLINFITFSYREIKIKNLYNFRGLIK